MSKLSDLARPEIVSMSAYSSARAEAPDSGILLNANEAPASLLESANETCQNLNRYPQMQPPDLLARLAELYAIPASRLLVTRGSDEGIDLLTRVFCRPGEDAVIECPPCFGMYRIAATIQGAAVIRVPRRADWTVDADAVVRAVRETPGLRLVFLTSPNNPTGDLLPSATLERVLDASAGRALVVLDEAYIEFTKTPSASRLIERYSHLVVLRTLSKAWAAAGLRCGVVLADPEVIGLLRRIMAPYPLPSHTVTTALQVTAPALRAGQAAMLAAIDVAKREFVSFLDTCAWVEDCWPGSANFVLLRVVDADGLTRYCAEREIRLRQFREDERLRDCVRISIGSENDMAALRSALESYGDGS